MSVSLRGYQTEVLVDVAARLNVAGSSVMLQLPTGGGKTVVAAELLRVIAANRAGRVHAWLTHRRELRDQSSAVLRGCGLRTVMLSDLRVDQRAFDVDTVCVVSPSMRAGWPKTIPNAGLLIVDEAHHAPARTWGRVIDLWRRSGGVVVGLTATPCRLKKGEGFGGWFNELVCGPSITELERLGWLATAKVVTPTSAQIDLRDVERVAGDYNKQQVGSRAVALLHQPIVVDYWMRYTARLRDRRTLWFVPSVHAAEVLRERLVEVAAGGVGVISAGTPTLLRDNVLAGLRDHTLTHVISVDVLGEGVDLPSVPVVAMLRATLSLSVFLQQAGRGARPKTVDPETLGGGVYHLLDYARNTVEHGLPNLRRGWSLDAAPVLDGGGDVVLAACWLCRRELHPQTRFCTEPSCEAKQFRDCVGCANTLRWTRFGEQEDTMCVACCEAVAAAKKAAAVASAAAAPVLLSPRSRQSLMRAVTDPRVLKTAVPTMWFAVPSRQHRCQRVLTVGDVVDGQIVARSGKRWQPTLFTVVAETKYGDPVLVETSRLWARSDGTRVDTGLVLGDGGRVYSVPASNEERCVTRVAAAGL